MCAGMTFSSCYSLPGSQGTVMKKATLSCFSCSGHCRMKLILFLLGYVIAVDHTFISFVLSRRFVLVSHLKLHKWY